MRQIAIIMISAMTMMVESWALIIAILIVLLMLFLHPGVPWRWWIISLYLIFKLSLSFKENILIWICSAGAGRSAFYCSFRCGKCSGKNYYQFFTIRNWLIGKLFNLLQEITDRSQAEVLPSGPKTGSNSAPMDSGMKESNVSTSAKRFHSYVLPTPADFRSAASALPLTPLEPPDNHPRKPPPLPFGEPMNSKRQAFSGPLPSKSSSSKPHLVLPRVHTPPLRVSGALHELPRPPSFVVPVGPAGPVRAPLVTTKMASPLPRPPGTMSRSFSIPSSSQRSSLNAIKLTSSPLVKPMALTPSWAEFSVRETLND